MWSRPICCGTLGSGYKDTSPSASWAAPGISFFVVNSSLCKFWVSLDVLESGSSGLWGHFLRPFQPGCDRNQVTSWWRLARGASSTARWYPPPPR